MIRLFLATTTFQHKFGVYRGTVATTGILLHLTRSCAAWTSHRFRHSALFGPRSFVPYPRAKTQPKADQPQIVWLSQVRKVTGHCPSSRATAKDLIRIFLALLETRISPGVYPELAEGVGMTTRTPTWIPGRARPSPGLPGMTFEIYNEHVINDTTAYRSKAAQRSRTSPSRRDSACRSSPAA